MQTIKNKFRRKRQTRLSERRCRSGVATVEAAIMLPILIAVTLGSTDVAQYINLAQIVTNSSRQGARFACRDATTTVDEVETAVRLFFKQSFPSASSEVLNAAVDIEVVHPDGSPISQGNLNSVASGDPILVKVEFDFDSVRWFRGIDYLGSEVGRSRTIGRRE